MEEEFEQEMSIFDEKYPRSIINLLNGKVKDAVKKVNRKYIEMPEKKLEELVQPNKQDNQIRISFWFRYEEAQDQNLVRMSIVKIYKEICSAEYFYNNFLQDELKVAWMLRLKSGYKINMEEILDLGVKQFREIMLMPNKVGGKADTRLIAEKVKIFAIVDNRVKGAVTQKMQVENKNMNLNIQGKMPNTVQDVERELNLVNKQIKQIEADAKKPEYFKNDDNFGKPIYTEDTNKEVVDVGVKSAPDKEA